jgi:hypothetical protein
MITFIQMKAQNENNFKIFRNHLTGKVFKLIFNDQKLLCFKEMIKILQLFVLKN